MCFVIVEFSHKAVALGLRAVERVVFLVIGISKGVLHRRMTVIVKPGECDFFEACSLNGQYTVLVRVLLALVKKIDAIDILVFRCLTCWLHISIKIRREMEIDLL